MSTATLDVSALREACAALAREVLLERTEALSDRARELAGEFEDMVYEDLLAQLEPGRDPNLVVRVVQFLAQSTSSTIFEPYSQWFFGTVLILMEVACPTSETLNRCAEFYGDIEIGKVLPRRAASKPVGA